MICAHVTVASLLLKQNGTLRDQWGEGLKEILSIVQELTLLFFIKHIQLC